MIYQYQPDYPRVSRFHGDIDTLQPPYLGLDFEWDIHTERPTIIGASDGKSAVSVPFDDGIQPVITLLDRYPDLQLVGHNFIRAESVVMKKYGRAIPLDRIKDTIILHWLVNAHLCKAGGKATGEGGAGELTRRGPGFMNIWTMCSIHTSLPCWKFCREKQCHDIPCPKHQPFWYNGLDAMGPVQAVPDLLRRAKLLGVEKLYPFHARLNEEFQNMHERGAWVDKAFVEKMRAEFVSVKEVMWKDGQKKPTPESLPFNPESWQQIKNYFKDNYDLKLANTEEETIRAEVMQLEEGEIPELEALLEYKEMGSGPDRWYANKVWNYELRNGNGDWEGYVVDEGNGLGTIHPNINHFTSTGRTACSNPNMQNIEKRRIDRKNCKCGHPIMFHPEVEDQQHGIGMVPGPCQMCDCRAFSGDKIGERMRQAIIAPPGYNLYSADYSNGENRAMLHFAGYKIPPEQDLHSWMVANIGLTENDPFALLMGGAREASKSVTHAADYLEGLDLLSPNKLRSSYVKREVAAGARLIFPDWKFKDLTVSFTGGNLAQRAFGSKSWDNRKKALEIVQRYIDVTFPKLRDVHKMITKQVETEGMVRVPHGYVMRSYDKTPMDMLKTAVAMWGSNPIAHYLKVSLLNVAQHPRLIPVIPVHDEHVIYASTEYDPKDVKKWIEECMIFETPEMPGFWMPIKVKVSTREITGGGHPNWRNMKKIE